MTEDEIVGWHHQLNVHEFEQASNIGNRQGSLVCCSQWGRKEWDTPERLSVTDHCLSPARLSTSGRILSVSSNTDTLTWTLTH